MSISSLRKTTYFVSDKYNDEQFEAALEQVCQKRNDFLRQHFDKIVEIIDESLDFKIFQSAHASKRSYLFALISLTYYYKNNTNETLA